jgi:hypothetical protein
VASHTPAPHHPQPTVRSGVSWVWWWFHGGYCCSLSGTLCFACCVHACRTNAVAGGSRCVQATGRGRNHLAPARQPQYLDTRSTYDSVGCCEITFVCQPTIQHLLSSNQAIKQSRKGGSPATSCAIAVPLHFAQVAAILSTQQQQASSSFPPLSKRSCVLRPHYAGLSSFFWWTSPVWHHLQDVLNK